MASSIQLVFDCADPETMARFWARALGYEEEAPPVGFTTWPAFLEARGVPRADWDAFRALRDPEGLRPRLFFQRVPEPKVAKNRMHIDINAGGGASVNARDRRARVDAEVAHLKGLGASDLRGSHDDGDEYWVRMNDPEGNEFCVQ